MKFTDILFILVGLAFCLFGSIFLLGGVLVIVDPPEGQGRLGSLFFTLFFGAVPFSVGIWMFWRVWSRTRGRSKEVRERQVLMLATEKGGSLTVADVALATNMSSSQAKKILNQCHLDQLANMHVSESGVVVYTFYDMQKGEG